MANCIVASIALYINSSPERLGMKSIKLATAKNTWKQKITKLLRWNINELREKLL